MIRFFTFVSAVLLSASLWAQTPQSFSYQAVIRGTNNSLVANKPVGLKISLLQGSENGTVSYAETHNSTANDNGLVSIAIGGGNKISGDFAKIDWSKGPYFIKTETDPTGGSSYSLSSVSQLLSVPYALYSGNSQPGPKGDKGDKGDPGVQGPTGPKGDNGSFPFGKIPGEMNYWDGTTWKSVSPGNNGQGLTFCDGVPTWTTGGICPGKIESLNCGNASNKGSLTATTPANGVTTMISYVAGNGGAYNGQVVTSTGVTGLTATLSSGTFMNGDGSVTYTISGTPTTSGLANFTIVLGGKSCSFTFPVSPAVFVEVKTLTNDNIQSPFLCGGLVNAQNEKIIERGILYGKSQNLDYTSATTVGTFQYGLSQGGTVTSFQTAKITSMSGVGEFKVNIMYLFENIKYYYCAYAKTETGKIFKGEVLEIPARNFKRDTRSPDVANVFWKTTFNLFDLQTDEVILPDANGVYKFYYSSNEDPNVFYKELNASQLPNFLFYKFKTQENCKKWTEIKKGILKP